MKVKIKSFAILRDVMDKELDLELADKTTVSGLFKILCARFPGLSEQIFDDKGSLKEYVNILKNGRNIFFIDDLNTVLEDGDIIAMFPPVAGG